MGYLIFIFVVKDSCARLPTAMTQGGAAFACGATRMLVYGLVVTLTIIQLYCIFAVWSLCEDFQMGCSDHVFMDLQADIENSKRRNKMAPYGGILGHSAGSRVPFPVVYDPLLQLELVDRLTSLEVSIMRLIIHLTL